jgi:hypothetical protein
MEIALLKLRNESLLLKMVRKLEIVNMKLFTLGRNMLLWPMVENKLSIPSFLIGFPILAHKML